MARTCYNVGITEVIPMTKTIKTAVSLPRATFERAESFRRKKRRSRSGLYATALDAYLEACLKAEEIRELEARHVEGYRRQPEDPAEIEPLLRLALQSLPKEDW